MPLKVNRNKFYLLIFFIGVFLIILHYLHILSPIENLLINSTKKFLTNNNYQNTICATDESLKARVGILTDENKLLRQQLNFKQKTTLQTIGAEVMGQSVDINEHTLLINRGENDGIKIYQPVITDNGYLVGKISKTGKIMSSVLLINDNNSKIAVETLNKDKSIGVIEGGYGLSIKMSLIPRNETVLVGDQVITSGIEANMPRGILIGKIAGIENEAYQPFQQAVVIPYVNLTKIHFLNVITAY